MHVHADPSRRSNEEALEERRSFRLTWSMLVLVASGRRKQKHATGRNLYLPVLKGNNRACMPELNCLRFDWLVLPLLFLVLTAQLHLSHPILTGRGSA